ncbi:MAG: 23S rRNA (adenine(2030)-N(6))-methyltransferase RlmJ [Rhodobacteraceae bacterium]|nr:23S rRNA (adenine(2030)-N(6))-methyltransferase RlmJ [Paracoccaceae bacterium]
MLSYQHSYHAGGPADVHKHLVLAELLALLTKKSRGISYLETHAGRGLYDLSSDDSLKTGEAAEGINAITLPDCPLVKTLRNIQQKYGPDAYPGSPMIARELLRDQDRLHLMELHPVEYRNLRQNLMGEGVSLHRRDGYEGVFAITPPKPRKGLVLIDPSYEIKTEYAEVAEFSHRLMDKWPEATIMIWYPLLEADRHLELVQGLKLPFLKHEVGFDLKDGKGMTGSGLILINAPYRSDEILQQVEGQTSGLLQPLG